MLPALPLAEDFGTFLWRLLAAGFAYRAVVSTLFRFRCHTKLLSRLSLELAACALRDTAAFGGIATRITDSGAFLDRNLGAGTACLLVGRFLAAYTAET